MEKVLAAGGIVFNQADELLMICRRQKWDLPKGHKEKNESLQECALREVKEETGLKTLEVIRFIGTTEHVYFDSKFNAEVIKETHWYEMRGDKNERLNAQTAESIDWIQWIKRELVHTYLNNSFDNIIEILGKVFLINNPSSRK